MRQRGSGRSFSSAKRTRSSVLALLLIALSVGSASFGFDGMRSSPSPSVQEETLLVPGLERPVEILRDRWGVAHIYAQTEHDLFFAQGYTVARDRLFQLELWRRQATGTLAEAFGPRFLEHDRAARLFRFRGDLEAELRHYHPRGPQIIGAFVAGINARIAEVLKTPEQLPLEFRILDFRPDYWTPEVVISRHNGLYGNALQELQTALLVRALGSERARALLDLRPEAPQLIVDEAVDLKALSPEILSLYERYRSTITFRPEDVRPEYRASHAETSSEPAPTFSDAQEEGSNNWVIAGRLSLSRKPLLANDPHRALQVPSLRYWVHLVGPGWNVVGAGEPAVPGVAIGHNEYGAWGLTVFSIDMEDIYVYERHPQDPNRYRYGDGWETMRVEREVIRVKGQAPVTVELKYTRHGPVIFEDPSARRAYALRAAWLDVGGAPYLASLRIAQARNWEEFRQACRYWYTPGENLVWADRSGRIGWQVVGRVPIRPNWTGLVPVPGDGRYEWAGFVAFEALPERHDPPEGWIATANEENLPAGYQPIPSYSWAEPFRAARLQELLSEQRRFTLADLARIQHDELSIPARLLVPLLRPLRLPGQLPWAQQRLLEWNFVLDQRSAAAALYVAWERRLLENYWNRRIPEQARPFFRSRPLQRMIEALYAPDGTFGPDPIRGREELLVESLAQAVRDVTERLGADWRAWTYGHRRFKRVLF
ncbi:MAG: penicillin acylase family protein, partial [Blastocatellia bacterium]|nr:penicillin acylase family protein [Blastocatellia bacterium]MDW8255493.1 penicillin acylase family protein [Acidobacteriota bacterium]